MSGFEPETSSLPRKHSTPELHRQFSLMLESFVLPFSPILIPNSFGIKKRLQAKLVIRQGEPLLHSESQLSSKQTL